MVDETRFKKVFPKAAPLASQVGRSTPTTAQEGGSGSEQQQGRVSQQQVVTDTGYGDNTLSILNNQLTTAPFFEKSKLGGFLDWGLPLTFLSENTFSVTKDATKAYKVGQRLMVRLGEKNDHTYITNVEYRDDATIITIADSILNALLNKVSVGLDPQLVNKTPGRGSLVKYKDLNGDGNVIKLTPYEGYISDNPTKGTVLRFFADANNTGAVTINSKTVLSNGQGLIKDTIIKGNYHEILYNGDNWNLLSVVTVARAGGSSDSSPVGSHGSGGGSDWIYINSSTVSATVDGVGFAFKGPKLLANHKYRLILNNTATKHIFLTLPDEAQDKAKIELDFVHWDTDKIWMLSGKINLIDYPTNSLLGLSKSRYSGKNTVLEYDKTTKSWTLDHTWAKIGGGVVRTDFSIFRSMSFVTKKASGGWPSGVTQDKVWTLEEQRHVGGGQPPNSKDFVELKVGRSQKFTLNGGARGRNLRRVYNYYDYYSVQDSDGNYSPVYYVSGTRTATCSTGPNGGTTSISGHAGAGSDAQREITFTPTENKKYSIVIGSGGAGCSRQVFDGQWWRTFHASQGSHGSVTYNYEVT